MNPGPRTRTLVLDPVVGRAICWFVTAANEVGAAAAGATAAAGAGAAIAAGAIIMAAGAAGRNMLPTGGAATGAAKVAAGAAWVTKTLGWPCWTTRFGPGTWITDAGAWGIIIGIVGVI